LNSTACSSLPLSPAVTPPPPQDMIRENSIDSSLGLEDELPQHDQKTSSTFFSPISVMEHAALNEPKPTKAVPAQAAPTPAVDDAAAFEAHIFAMLMQYANAELARQDDEVPAKRQRAV